MGPTEMLVSLLIVGATSIIEAMVISHYIKEVSDKDDKLFQKSLRINELEIKNKQYVDEIMEYDNLLSNGTSVMQEAIVFIENMEKKLSDMEEEVDRLKKDKKRMDSKGSKDSNGSKRLVRKEKKAHKKNENKKDDKAKGKGRG